MAAVGLPRAFDPRTMIHPPIVERDEWRVCGHDALLAADAVDLWWLDFNRPPLEPATLAPSLTEAESCEVARFHRPEDRLQRAAARTYLRFVLAKHYLGCAPREVRWTRDPHGRPQLADGGTGNIDFNLSHAGSHVLMGVTNGPRIGVDIEVAGAVDVPALARLCATPIERDWLADADGGTVELNRFFRLWTMKEAVLKCHGLGLGFDPRHCELDPVRGRARLRGPDGLAEIFTVATLPLAPGIFGAVAWRGDESRSLRHWRAADDWIHF